MRNPACFSFKLLAKIFMARLGLSSTPLVYLWSSSIENPDALKTCLKLTISWHLLLICFVSDIQKSRKMHCSSNCKCRDGFRICIFKQSLICFYGISFSWVFRSAFYFS